MQVYVALGGFEESIGLDPNDPLIPVVLVFGVSAILWYKFLVFSLHSVFSLCLSYLKNLENNHYLLLSFKCKLHFSSDFCRGSYRVLKYSGYAGDLSPESAMELLRGNDNAVLIDIRPEARDCNFSSIKLLTLADRYSLKCLSNLIHFASSFYEFHLQRLVFFDKCGTL